MSTLYTLEDTKGQSANIKVFGIGGGGGNALNNMIDHQLRGVEFIVANTDAQAITRSKANVKVQLGTEITRGLGAGADPEKGRQAAEEERENIREILRDTDMVFITAGMGGGTGTGGTPVIAEVAQEMGILTVAVVTKPFQFEGKRRMRQAEEGIEALRGHVDTLIIIPNQKLISAVGKNTTMLDAFRQADDVLLQAVRGIAELITQTGYINVDFADVKAVMTETQGMAMMGSGVSNGEGRAVDAAELAINSPLLDDVDIHGAQGLLVNVTGSEDMTLMEYDEAICIIQDMADEDANIICGMVYDEDCGDEIRVTVVATGLNQAKEQALLKKKLAKAVPVVTAPEEVIPTYEEPVKPACEQPMQKVQTPAVEPVHAALKESSPLAESKKDSKQRSDSKQVYNRDGGYNEGVLQVPTWLRRQSKP
ncbi:MAG: cell division protein FtsZ [Mariprofundaceae bacterium]|nr:cell division protein FtsZ [Mariprofundaceae bacterium]